MKRYMNCMCMHIRVCVCTNWHIEINFFFFGLIIEINS